MWTVLPRRPAAVQLEGKMRTSYKDWDFVFVYRWTFKSTRRRTHYATETSTNVCPSEFKVLRTVSTSGVTETTQRSTSLACWALSLTWNVNLQKQDCILHDIFQLHVVLYYLIYILLFFLIWLDAFLIRGKAIVNRLIKKAEFWLWNKCIL